MSAADREKWDAKYAGRELPDRLTPDDWLTAHAGAWPPGEALELACGTGHNAVWLAQHGWQVEAVDISPVGLSLAEQLRRRVHAPPVHWRTADIGQLSLPAEQSDLVVVFRFLDRDHLPALIQGALRPGGRLIYETFLRTQLDRPDNHLRNPAFTLHSGELPQLFPELSVQEYREISLSDRTVAQLLAEKPAG